MLGDLDPGTARLRASIAKTLTWVRRDIAGVLGEPLSIRLDSRPLDNGRWLQTPCGWTGEDFRKVLASPPGEKIPQSREVTTSAGTTFVLSGYTERRPFVPSGFGEGTTCGDVLAFVENGADDAARGWAADIETVARLFIPDEKVRRAVLRREEVLDNWPKPTSGRWWDLFDGLQNFAMSYKTGFGVLGVQGSGRGAWPPRADALSVAEWSRAALETVRPGLGEAFVQVATNPPGGKPFSWFRSEPFGQEGVTFDHEGRTLRLTESEVASLYVAEREVLEGLKRPAIAVDSGQEHHSLVSSMRDLPRNMRRPHRFDVVTDERGERWELLAPGRAIQLEIFPNETQSEAFIRAMRDWRRDGLRHWAAFLRQFSIEGERGPVRWTLDSHLDALGVSTRLRESLAYRNKVAALVERMTEMKLAVISEDGSERERRPLIHVGAQFDKLKRGKWRLEGMELWPNPRLYEGVRKLTPQGEGESPAIGELGSNWSPAPLELARIDDTRFPYAIALGLVLSIRWRWTWKENPRADHVPLSGGRLLAAAGITFEKHDPRRTWEKLTKSLGELRRIGLLDRWEWEGGEPNREAVCRLYPARWIADRTLGGLAPNEPKRLPPILTGKELRAWRTERGLSQAELARRLGVSKRTLIRDEKAADKPLGPTIREAFWRIPDR